MLAEENNSDSADSSDWFKPKKRKKENDQNASEPPPLQGKTSSLKCQHCEKVFMHRQSLHRHKTKCLETNSKRRNSNTKKESVPKKAEQYVCNDCNVQIKNKHSFFDHLKICKKEKEDSKYTNCYFPDCPLKFYHKIQIIKHLKEAHFQDVNIQTLQFSNKDEFLQFKKEKNMQYFMSSVKHSGSTKNEKGDTYHYYICNFDVQNHKTKEGIQLKSKIPGSNCPARLLTKETKDGEFKVKFINQHNHSIEVKNLQYQRYPKESLNYMKTMLSKGVKERRIRDDLVPLDVDSVYPIKEHFLELKEIRDLNYRMRNQSSLAPTDGAAVRLLVEKLHKEEDSILLYKPQNTMHVENGRFLTERSDSFETFALGYQNERMRTEFVKGAVRITNCDATHNTNKYKFQLLALIVPDEYNKGYPVAWFISNKMDTDMLTNFFTAVKERSPTLEVNALMTDDDTALVSSFRNVFGQHVRHLLCTWHLKRTWQKQLCAYIKNEELRKEIYQHLMVLLEELDVNRFKAIFLSFIDKYNNRKETKGFITYFLQGYAARTAAWATCYRGFEHAQTDTNMYCESFFSGLKTIFLDNRWHTKLVDLIQLLIYIEFREKYCPLRNKRLKQKPLPGMKKSKDELAAHKKGVQLPDAGIVKLSDDTWSIESESRKNLQHTVRRYHKTCPTPEQCEIRCEKKPCLDLCSHLFKCTCENKNPLCKHIHKIHMFTRASETPDSCQKQNIESTSNDMDWKLHDSLPLELPEFSIEKASKKVSDCQRIFQKLSEGLEDGQIQENLLHYFHGTTVQLEAMYDSVKARLASFPPLPTMKYDKQAPNQKKEKQPTDLFQTKKKREKSAPRFPHPSKEERFVLTKQMFGIDTEMEAETLSGYVARTYHDLNKTMFKINTEPINMLHFKTLEHNMPAEELSRIWLMQMSGNPTFYSAHPGAIFKKGFLCDSIIDAYLYILTKNKSNASYIRNYLTQRVRDKSTNIEQHFGQIHNQVQGATKICIPLNVTGNHWVFLFCDVTSRTMLFLDPLMNCPLTKLRPIYKTAIETWQRVLQTYYNNQWTVSTYQHTLQNDGINCGVFVCWYAEQLINNQHVNYKLDPIAYRIRIARRIWDEGIKKPEVYLADVWNPDDGPCPYKVVDGKVVIDP